MESNSLMRLIIIIAFSLLFANNLFSANETPCEINIGASTWKVWLDENASWKEDTLYLPQDVDLKRMGVASPGCGWSELYKTGKDASLPVCVEELFSDGNAHWTYHGVSWFSSTFEMPAGWKDKVVRLYIGKKNLRLEVYVNEKLAGYDIIAGTPYVCDISKYILPGSGNRIAFRITNPGGQRGWNDFPLITWGSYKFPAHHDFGGIGGEVKLLVTDKIYIDDVFVKNLLPARANNIEVQTTICNTTVQTLSAGMSVRITSVKDNKSIFEKHFNFPVDGLTEFVIKETLTVPGAELWDVDHPNLYKCEVNLTTDESNDQYNQVFGFRVFEVRGNDNGEENFYLNGTRFRHRSAIDWGFYAHHGYYPSAEMAKKSIEAAKAIGHNGINCHRNMGDPLLLKYADELGLIIFEEPGGFDETIRLYNEINSKCIPTFEGRLIESRCLRMSKRDRTHPSVTGYILANERDIFDLLRKNIMIDMHALDDSKLIVNQSGGVPGGPSGQIPHLRPYDRKFRLDYMDDHTVYSDSRFKEYDFLSHRSANDTMKYGVSGRINPQESSNIIYWGEVRCYAGPDNWYQVYEQSDCLPDDRTGYDRNSFRPLAEKIESYFNQNNLPQTGSKNIQSPGDVTLQAGRGLMYIDGRLDQIIMSNNSMDGFAINGWSGGASGIPKEHGEAFEWYSAIVDEGRNLKGPARDYNNWNRPLQVALFRKNGKYFEPGEEIRLEAHLINEGLLAPGDYELILKVKDGSGNYTDYVKTMPLTVKGGDTYAQPVTSNFAIQILPDWKAGYLTVEGSVIKNGKVMAIGMEQVLLKNRASWKAELKDINPIVYDWPAASEALIQAGIRPVKKSGHSVILAGNIPAEHELDNLLRQVGEGATIIVKFDRLWADKLFGIGILREKVTQWGGEQIPFWNGNGWGYIDHFIGNQAIPGVTSIGTNGWEVPSDPIGFYPFISNYPQKAYGAWFARPNTLLVLIGEIAYGKGKILLTPSYPVNENNAFTDILFFHTIIHSKPNLY